MDDAEVDNAIIREQAGRIAELEAALAAEREACAKLVEEYGAHHREHFANKTDYVDVLCDDIAEIIRGRDASAAKDTSQ